MKVVAVTKDGSCLRFVEISDCENPYRILYSCSNTFERINYNGFEPDYITTSLSAKQTYSKRLYFPFSSQKKIRKAFDFQLQGLPISHKTHSVILDIQADSSGGAGVECIAASYADIDAIIQEFNDYGFSIDFLGCEQKSIEQFLYTHQLNEVDLVLNIRAEAALLLYVKQCQVLDIFHLSTGAKQLATILTASNIKQVHREQLDKFELHLQRKIDFLKTKHQLTNSLNFLTLGYANQLKILDNHPLVSLLRTDIPDEKLFFAQEIGTALNVFGQKRPTIQFLKGAYTPNKLMLHVKKKFAVFAFLLAIITSTTILGTLLFQRRHMRMFQKQIETELKTAHLEDRYIIKPKNLKELKSQIETIDYDIFKKRRFYDLSKKPPKVSELINWIAARTTQLPKASIESLSFELIKYPQTKTPRKPYQAKIQIVLTHLEVAQKFCELLNAEMPNAYNISIHDEKNRPMVTFDLS